MSTTAAPQIPDTVHRPEPEAFERCLIQALPPQSRARFLPPDLYLKKRALWLRALPGFGLLILTLLLVRNTLQPASLRPCDYSVPDFHLLPEETQHLFTARRALTVSDTSPLLQATLAACRKGDSEQTKLLRFYLIYDPILNPAHLAARSDARHLRFRVQDALDELEALPVSDEVRAALRARLLTAQWILHGTDDALVQAWTATETSLLRRTLDRLDLQLFILHRLLEQSSFAEAIRFRGERRPRRALEALYKRLAAERNTAVQEVYP